MTLYEYKTVTVTKENEHGDISLEAEANHWAQQGWRVVSVIPKTGFLTGIHQILIERVKEPPPVVYTPGTVVEHDHPLGVACGSSCPVLRQWQKLAPRSPKSDG